MPSIVKIIKANKFSPRPAEMGEEVKLTVFSPPPKKINVFVNSTDVTEGTVDPDETEVFTTSAKHIQLVNNLNTGKDVEVTLVTDANGNVTDFSSRVLQPSAKPPSPSPSPSPSSSGASSDSAIPIT